MEHRISKNERATKDLAATALRLGQLSMDFARVPRISLYNDGRHESNVEHSYMLAMVATHFAHELSYDLDHMLVSQFTLVHDLPEVITGDIPTLGISNEDRAKKEADEAVATQQLVKELPEPWASLLARYEKQQEPEARFVRLVDKVMPLIVNINGDGLGALATYGITTAQQVRDAELNANAKLRQQFPEFPEILALREELIRQRTIAVFGE